MCEKPTLKRVLREVKRTGHAAKPHFKANLATCLTDGICRVKNALQGSQLYLTMMMIFGQVKEKNYHRGRN